MSNSTPLVSACNSNVFASGRLLRAIARRGQAPTRLSRLDRRGVPAQAIRLALGLQLGAVVINYLFPTQAFHLLVISSAVPLLWTWLMIVVAHLRRRGNDAAIGSLRMPWAPVSN